MSSYLVTASTFPPLASVANCIYVHIPCMETHISTHLKKILSKTDSYSVMKSFLGIFHTLMLHMVLFLCPLSRVHCYMLWIGCSPWQVKRSTVLFTAAEGSCSFQWWPLYLLSFRLQTSLRLTLELWSSPHADLKQHLELNPKLSASWSSTLSTELPSSPAQSLSSASDVKYHYFYCLRTQTLRFAQRDTTCFGYRFCFAQKTSWIPGIKSTTKAAFPEAATQVSLSPLLAILMETF